MLCTRSKVVYEIGTVRLTTVQISIDENKFANILQAKLSPTDDIVFARQRRLRISVLNVRCAHVNVIQGVIHKQNSQAFSGY